jgi:hypothetical protein
MRKKIALDIIFTSHELHALADLLEPFGDISMSRIGAEGLAIILRRMAKRLRKHSHDIEMENDAKSK